MESGGKLMIFFIPINEKWRATNSLNMFLLLTECFIILFFLWCFWSYLRWTCAPWWNICPHGNVHKENICFRRTMMLMEEKPDFIWNIRFMELYWHKSNPWNVCGKTQHRQLWYAANMLSKLAEYVFKLFRCRSETNSTSALTERISG